jgi:hypothetical protein
VGGIAHRGKDLDAWERRCTAGDLVAQGASSRDAQAPLREVGGQGTPYIQSPVRPFLVRETSEVADDVSIRVAGRRPMGQRIGHHAHVVQPASLEGAGILSRQGQECADIPIRAKDAPKVATTRGRGEGSVVLTDHDPALVAGVGQDLHRPHLRDDDHSRSIALEHPT